MAVIKSTDLDFEAIKESLKEYLQKSPDFKDYNFEASGLSSVLDVLAYNTHINGLVANFAINEAFLNSAQLRASVISHAEALGYNVRSKTASTANVNLTINTSLVTPTTVTLPAYTEFTAVVDGVSYKFLTTEDYVGYNNGSGIFTFRTTGGSEIIPLKEGTQKTKTFLVGDVEENQIYVIPDQNADTSTLDVKLYTSSSSSTFFTYTNINNQVRIEPTSRVYIIKESPNEFYEITFSDGNVLGISPRAGEKIVTNYISCSGEEANGATSFVADDTINISNADYVLNVTTVTQSSGGSEKESISSIKLNAPLAFASQQRLVTSDDYQALIKERYSDTIDDVAAWGGQDNIPPEYGKVFVSLNFKNGVLSSSQDIIKGSIQNTLSNNLAVMSISTEFVDPVSVYLELGTDFNFDPDLSGDTLQTVESQVRNTMLNYFANNLSTFNSVFRRSNLLSEIDDLSPAILNTRMEVKVQQRFVPTLGIAKNYSILFPMTIAAPDDENLVLTSSRFIYNGQDCNLQNKLKNNIIQIINEFDEVVIDNIGNYNQANGVVTLLNFSPSSFDGEAIKISVFPANQSTIRPLRNYILELDQGVSFARANIDYQNTAVTLT